LQYCQNPDSITDEEWTKKVAEWKWMRMNDAEELQEVIIKALAEVIQAIFDRK